MRLLSVRIENYRCVEDSGVVPIDEAVTCLVGKNESGKTAFLRALHLLNPVNPIKGKTVYDPVIDVPARKYPELKSQIESGSDPNVATAVLSLTDEEVTTLETNFGTGFVEDTNVTVKRGHGGRTTYKTSFNEQVAVQHFLQQLELLESQQPVIQNVSTFPELFEALNELEEPHTSVTDLIAKIGGWREHKLSLHLIDTYLSKWMPRFFYFDEYSTMPGRIALDDFKRKLESDEELTEGEKAFKAFLSLGHIDLSTIDIGDRTEAMIREVENAGIAITAQAMQFWTQNEGLRVQVRESPPDPAAEDPKLRSGQILNLRIENSNQFGLTSPFDERSSGFVWFFSFIAYFTGIEQDHEEGEIVLLLDEPGLGLHGTAQADFMRFINERLAVSHQVMYTTHSPFMIEPDRFERVRTVEDLPDLGTQISKDVFRSQPGTSLPILTKMGVDLFQTLMVGPNSLLVEGGSDFLYIQLLSQALIKGGRLGLDERWVLVPVTGVGKFAPFFRLYDANNINVAVLRDSTGGDETFERALRDEGREGTVVRVGDVLGRNEADIEDLIGADFYVKLVEWAYGEELPEPAAFTSQNPRIVKRVENHFEEEGINGGRFSHYEPAAYLRENKSLLAEIEDSALAYAEELFGRVNGLID